MKFPPYISTLSKLNMLEDWVLIHSIIYYDYDSNIAKDFVYDRNQEQLYDLIVKNQKEFKKSRLYRTYKNFNGSTGYDLKKRCQKFQPKEFERVSSNAKLLMYYAKKIWKIL